MNENFETTIMQYLHALEVLDIEKHMALETSACLKYCNIVKYSLVCFFLWYWKYLVSYLSFPTCFDFIVTIPMWIALVIIAFRINIHKVCILMCLKLCKWHHFCNTFERNLLHLSYSSGVTIMNYNQILLVLSIYFIQFSFLIALICLPKSR
mgnify:CR=1 FL=1